MTRPRWNSSKRLRERPALTVQSSDSLSSPLNLVPAVPERTQQIARTLATARTRIATRGRTPVEVDPGVAGQPLAPRGPLCRTRGETGPAWSLAWSLAWQGRPRTVVSARAVQALLEIVYRGAIWVPHITR